MKSKSALKKALFEYKGTKAEESYSSKKDMMKHEKSESKKEEAKEKKTSKRSLGKMKNC